MPITATTSPKAAATRVAGLVNLEEQLKFFSGVTPKGSSLGSLDADSSILDGARRLSDKSGLAPETVRDTVNAIARVEMQERGVDLDGLTTTPEDRSLFNETRLSVLNAEELVVGVATEVGKSYDSTSGIYPTELYPEEVYRELRGLHGASVEEDLRRAMDYPGEDVSLAGAKSGGDPREELRQLMDSKLDGESQTVAGAGGFSGELAEESARRREAAGELKALVQGGDHEGALDRLSDMDVNLYNGLGKIVFETDEEAAKAGLDLLEKSATVPGVPLSTLMDVYENYRGIPEPVRDQIDFTQYAGIHPKGGGEWDVWRHNFFHDYACAIDPEIFDFQQALSMNQDELRQAAKTAETYNAIPKTFKDKIDYDEFTALSDHGKVMLVGFTEVGQPEQLDLDFIRGLDNTERKSLSEVSQDERDAALTEIREAREAQEQGDKTKAMKLGWRLHATCEFPPALGLNDSSTTFDYFEKRAGYTDLQVEANRIQKRIQEARVAIEGEKNDVGEVIKPGSRAKLSGLRGSEAHNHELDVLGEHNLVLKNDDGLRRLNLGEFDRRLSEGETLEDIAGELNFKPVRLNLLVERERSKEYLAESRTDGKFDPFKMSSIRYLTSGELAEEREWEVDQLERARLGCRSDSGLRRMGKFLEENVGVCSIDAVGDKTRYSELFKTLEGLNVDDRREVLDSHITSKKAGLEMFRELAKGGRSGLDPGVLLFDELRSEDFQDEYGAVSSALGVYTIGSNYKGELGATGLIIVPAKHPPTIKHEADHFNDHMFYAGERKGFDDFVSELNSRMTDVAAEQHDWEGTKRVLVEKYLPIVKKQEGREEAEDKVSRSIDVIQNLQGSGVSDEAIRSVLMQAHTYDDILKWEPLFMKPEEAPHVQDGTMNREEFLAMQKTARGEFQEMISG